METGKRYRLLIYFAVLALCLSVCFAYAEEPGAQAPTVATSCQPAHLLFGSMPGRSSFLPSLQAQLVVSPLASAPVATADAVLLQLGLQANHSSRGFMHVLFPSRHKVKLVKQHNQEHLSAAASSPRMSADIR